MKRLNVIFSKKRENLKKKRFTFPRKFMLADIKQQNYHHRSALPLNLWKKTRNREGTVHWKRWFANNSKNFAITFDLNEQPNFGTQISFSALFSKNFSETYCWQHFVAAVDAFGIWNMKQTFAFEDLNEMSLKSNELNLWKTWKNLILVGWTNNLLL